MKKVILCFFLFIGLFTTTQAQTAPALGTAAEFTILAGTRIFNTDATTVTGNLGVAPGTSITGFSAGQIIGNQHINNAKAQAAQTDLKKAYNNIAALPTSTNGNKTGQDLSSQTLGPGVYTFNANASLSGTITLNAGNDPNAIFIFQIKGDLTVAPGTVLNLSQDARRSNIYWQIAGTANLGANSRMLGNFLAINSINLGHEATLAGGRLLTTDGEVTLDKNSPVKPTTDLKITISKSNNNQGGVNPYSVGEEVTFTIEAENLGPIDDGNVTVTDDLNAALEYLATTTAESSIPGKQVNNFTFNTQTRRVEWKIGELRNGEIAKLFLKVKIISSGVIDNTPTISGSEIDDNFFNQSSSISPTICAKITNPGTIVGPKSVCMDQGTYFYSIPAVANANSYNWSAPTGWKIIPARPGEPNTNFITIQVPASTATNPVATSGTIRVTVTTCAESEPSYFDVTASSSPSPSPGPITAVDVSAQNPCVKNSETYVTYKIDEIDNADLYEWVIYTPDDRNNTGNWQIVSGNTTPQILVKAGDKEVIIEVRAINGCGPSAASTLRVKPSLADPVKPADLIGPSTVCVNQPSGFFVATGAEPDSRFDWQLPSGWSIVSGNGTSQIRVLAPASAANIPGLVIKVAVINGCGVSEYITKPVLAIDKITAGPIAGPATPCVNTTVTYSVQAAGATSFAWEVTGNLEIIGNAAGASVSVLIKPGGGTIYVSPRNECGRGADQSLLITPENKLTAPSTITSSLSNPCTATEVTYSIPEVAGATGYTWQILDASGQPATGWEITTTSTNQRVITVKAGSQPVTISVTANNNCGPSDARTLAVTPVTAVPPQPVAIRGTANPCFRNTKVVYEIDPVVGATYQWQVPGSGNPNDPDSWIITNSANSPRIEVTIGRLAGEVKVIVSNNCGPAAATLLAVTPSLGPAPAPGPITASQVKPCVASENITYSIDPVPGATQYRWKLPTGWVITAGDLTTRITVKVGETAGDIEVYAVNGCAEIGPTKLAVAPTTAVLNRPLAIQGETLPCLSSGEIEYRIAAVTGATGYSWEVPKSWQILSGQNTPIIKVQVGPPSANPADDVIKVTANNPCGPSAAQTLVVRPVNTLPAAPEPITGNTNICADEPKVSYAYAVAEVTGASYYFWTLPTGNGWKIISGQGTPNILIQAGTTEGLLTVKTRNGCGENPVISQKLLTPSQGLPAKPGVITASKNPVCANERNLIYSVAPLAGVTIYHWTLPEGWEITAGHTTNRITVNAGTKEGNIYVNAFNNCGPGEDSAPLATKVISKPAAPVAITGETIPCNGSNGNKYKIDAVLGATRYIWSMPAGWSITAGEGTPEITVLAGNTPGTITVKAANDCFESDPVTLAVTPATAEPLVPGLIRGSKSVCRNQGNLEYTIDAVANASQYIWTVPTGWKIVSGEGTTRIIVNATTTPGTISVLAKNGCGFSATASVSAVSVTDQQAVAPGPITGNRQVCANEDDLTYTIGSVSGATGYNWIVPEANGWKIISGQGTTAIKVQAGAKAGEVKVQALNGCGSSADRVLAVTLTNVPDVPGFITGTQDQCAGNTNQVYTITAMEGAEIYVWEVPAGWKIDAGQGTTSIRVTTGAASGDIKVSAKNKCGLGAASILTVTSASVPAPAPAAILGDTQVLVCSNQENLNFAIEPVPDAVYYIWEIMHDNSGWEITAGQGTISIQVKAGTQIGTISVKAVNGCGASGAAIVVVNPSAAASVKIGAITGPASTCSEQSNLVYSVPEVGGATNYTWTVPAGWKITAGANTPTITVTAGKNAGEVSVIAANNCASSVASKLAVTVNPASPAPGRIKELGSPCAGLVYAVDALDGATGYIWTVPTGWTIKEGQGTTQIKVLAPAGSKEGMITATAQTTACATASATLLANATLGQADLAVSNVFSPNGDGVNDAWNIANIQNYPENELVVINRWGSEVYRAKTYQNNWNGGQLTAGTYYYVLKVKLCSGDYQTQKGYVMIMR